MTRNAFPISFPICEIHKKECFQKPTFGEHFALADVVVVAAVVILVDIAAVVIVDDVVFVVLVVIDFGTIYFR